MHGVTLELRNRGFDLKGKRVNPGNSLPMEETRRCLAGMCELHLLTPIKSADSARIQESAKKIVDGIMHHCLSTRGAGVPRTQSASATRAESRHVGKTSMSETGRKLQGKVSTRPQRNAEGHISPG